MPTRFTAVTLATLALVGLMSLAGCDDDDVGVLCSGPRGGDDTGSSFLISQSLECRKRLCVLKEGATNPKSRCTRVCESDGDCPEEGPNCNEGFLCRVATQVNILGLQCCKLCICMDDLSLEERERDVQEQACKEQGIEPKCPKL